jgi:TfoX/Sxy family transcriptional regulator of competence genes
MATSPHTIDFLLGQLRGLPQVRARKMFGEYALYLDDRVVGLVCDDRLYVKPLDAARVLLGVDVEEAPPYPGAKLHLVVPEERWCEDPWFADLLLAIAAALPAPKRRASARRR